jgi:hypothetical protein
MMSFHRLSTIAALLPVLMISTTQFMRGVEGFQVAVGRQLPSTRFSDVVRLGAEPKKEAEAKKEDVPGDDGLDLNLEDMFEMCVSFLRGAT